MRLRGLRGDGGCAHATGPGRAAPACLPACMPAYATSLRPGSCRCPYLSSHTPLLSAFAGPRAKPTCLSRHSTRRPTRHPPAPSTSTPGAATTSAGLLNPLLAITWPVPLLPQNVCTCTYAGGQMELLFAPSYPENGHLTAAASAPP